MFKIICTVLEINSLPEALEMGLGKIYTVFCEENDEIRLLKNGGKQEVN